MPTIYTNTGKARSIIGLLVTTLCLAYISQNSTKIVEGTITFVKTGVKSGYDALRRKPHYQVRRDVDGKYYLQKVDFLGRNSK